MFKEMEERHMTGFLSIEMPGMGHSIPECDLGIQIAKDGRVWLCINGKAAIRFLPSKTAIVCNEKIKKNCDNPSCFHGKPHDRTISCHDLTCCHMHEGEYVTNVPRCTVFKKGDHA